MIFHTSYPFIFVHWYGLYIKRLSSSKWILSKMKAALSLLPLKLNELVVAFVFLSWAGDVPHLLQPQPPIPILVARPVRRGDTPDKHNICPNPSYLSISLVPDRLPNLISWSHIKWPIWRLDPSLFNSRVSWIFLTDFTT